ncbi:MAG: hypothetical protein R6X14_05610 [bacterium]
MASALTGPDGAAGRLAAGLIGRESACRVLAAFLAREDLPPLLFAGPESSGKRTIALRLARAANCLAEPGERPCGECRACRTIAALNHPDVRLLFPPARRARKKDRAEEDEVASRMAAIVEQTPAYGPDRQAPPLDPALAIPIEAVRWVRHEMARPPFGARRRFFIVLHAERMTAEAANAFLKTLEEPQQQSTLVLTTSAPSMLLDTVRSRCRLVRFPAVRAEDIRQWLVATHGAGPEAAALAAEIANGSPGRALRFLESPDDYLSPAVVEFFCNPGRGAGQVSETLDRLAGASLTTVTGSFLFLLDQTLRVRHGLPTCYAAANPDLQRRAATLPDDYLRRAIRYVNERLGETRLNVNRKLFLYTLLASLRRP